MSSKQVNRIAVALATGMMFALNHDARTGATPDTDARAPTLDAQSRERPPGTGAFGMRAPGVNAIGSRAAGAGPTGSGVRAAPMRSTADGSDPARDRHAPSGPASVSQHGLLVPVIRAMAGSVASATDATPARGSATH